MEEIGKVTVGLSRCMYIEVLLDCADSISRPIETNTLLTTFDFQYDSIYCLLASKRPV